MPITAKLDEIGKPAWIALIILGFMAWWPLGLSVLAFTIWSGRMGCGYYGGQDRWLREEPARQLIDETDAQRRRFFENAFGVDWSDPLEYHITVNTGRLGPLAVDLVTLLAARHWSSR